jgi:hypothetical protein
MSWLATFQRRQDCDTLLNNMLRRAAISSPRFVAAIRRRDSSPTTQIAAAR